MTRDDVRANLASWEAESEAYQERGREVLNDWSTFGWGIWQTPESEVHALGDVAGMDALELGCGAAQFGIRVARASARVVGVDISANQLAAAAPNMDTTGIRFPLVRGNVEELPFADASFDLVFCDHGAVTFTDPAITVPEVARVLRPDGRFVFNMSTPFIWATWPMIEGPPGRELLRPYFANRRMVWDPSDPGPEFQLPYGEWIALFRENGLAIDALIELRPREGATSPHGDYVTFDWARDFPAEHIWKVRKERS
jgi:SAM-dependent methyltransferase